MLHKQRCEPQWTARADIDTQALVHRVHDVGWKRVRLFAQHRQRSEAAHHGSKWERTLEATKLPTTLLQLTPRQGYSSQLIANVDRAPEWSYGTFANCRSAASALCKAIHSPEVSTWEETTVLSTMWRIRLLCAREATPNMSAVQSLRLLRARQAARYMSGMPWSLLLRARQAAPYMSGMHSLRVLRAQ